MIVTSKTPMLDLHGEIEAMVEVLVRLSLSFMVRALIF